MIAVPAAGIRQRHAARLIALRDMKPQTNRSGLKTN